MTLARDLGDGPHRPFGSAIRRNSDGDRVDTIPLVGRTVKPRFLGPCKHCGERRWFCECEDEQ